MKTIEKIKEELTQKISDGTFALKEDIINLPVDDDLREFICNISILAAGVYAKYVDKGPHNITREACCKNSFDAYWYAVCIDESPHPMTREAIYRDPNYKELYIKGLGE